MDTNDQHYDQRLVESQFWLTVMWWSHIAYRATTQSIELKQLEFFTSRHPFMLQIQLAP